MTLAVSATAAGYKSINTIGKNMLQLRSHLVKHMVITNSSLAAEDCQYD